MIINEKHKKVITIIFGSILFFGFVFSEFLEMNGFSQLKKDPSILKQSAVITIIIVFCLLLFLRFKERLIFLNKYIKVVDKILKIIKAIFSIFLFVAMVLLLYLMIKIIYY